MLLREYSVSLDALLSPLYVAKGKLWTLNVESRFGILCREHEPSAKCSCTFLVTIMYPV